MAHGKLALMVLGSHRSGTSAMTHVMALSGFNLPGTILPPQPDNPAGFWESSVIVALNDEILAMRDARWHDIFPPDDAPLLSNSGAVILAKAEAAIASEFGGATPIVLKDPRISILTTFWKRVLERQGYQSAFLIMVRNPVEVAASLAKRNGFSHERGLLIWLTNMLATERKSRGSRRLFVSYERLLTDVFGILDDVESMIGQLLPRRTRVADLEVQRALNADLRHHRMTGEIAARGELERLVTGVYSWFLASSRGEALDTGVLDCAAARLQACEEVVGGVIAELRSEPERLILALETEHIRAELLCRDLDVVAKDAANLGKISVTQQTHLAALQVSFAAEQRATSFLRTLLMSAETKASTGSREVAMLKSKLDALNVLRSEWLSEKAALTALHRNQQTQIDDLRGQTSNLSKSIAYIQSRLWWRGLSWLRRLVK